ncbi:MAG: tetratricopeptide repeat protein [Propionibacteriaceae bacterium]
MTCTTANCSGTIIDGYCNICGMPPGANTTSNQIAKPAVNQSEVVVTNKQKPRCLQPQCVGTIIDGYCDTCGAPIGAPPLRKADPAVTAAASDKVIAPNAGLSSQTIGVLALGSARLSQDTTRRYVAGPARIKASHLGQGLTIVPSAPVVAPESCLMETPCIPEDKRICPSCNKQVGQSNTASQGRLSGFCPHCQARYDFSAKLSPGDLVAGQYEVAGALAHGGMGWIYLAKDRNVSNRWVVLKGILNSEDKDLVAAAIAEQRFLAQVQHPLIVEIYNFVTFEGAGYIVMEYVGGRSLKELLRQYLEQGTTLPVEQAIAFILEVLPAFSYLHDNGLLYCDFKPDNVIQVGDAIKLIDLGGVRRIGDNDSAIYGTVGYQAPEIATQGPSIASDIFTLGRTLLMLCTDLKGYQSTYQYTLPTPDEVPLLAQHDSLYRLLLTCCAPDPNDRFTSAEELRIQLLGVLREVVGTNSGKLATVSWGSLLFSDPKYSDSDISWDQLPRLSPDLTDPQYAFVQGINVPDPRQRLAALSHASMESPEVLIARAYAALEINDEATVVKVVQQMLNLDPWEWRALWITGLAALIRKDSVEAKQAFNAVYGRIPGELAPQFALAVACQLSGDNSLSERFYNACAATDASYLTPAAFALTRMRVPYQNLPEIIETLDTVPTTSPGYVSSRRLRVYYLVKFGRKLSDLIAADESLASAQFAPDITERYRVNILSSVLKEVLTNGEKPNQTIAGVPIQVKPLQKYLFNAYRRLAENTLDKNERINFIEAANHYRQWSLL